MNYEEDIKIDPLALDVEWLQQPQKFIMYARQAAEADRRVKRLHERLKTIRSDLIYEVNTEPNRCLGMGVKPKDSLIEAYYRRHDRYKKAKNELHDAELERDLLQAAVSAFHQRKMALENLVKLAGQQYFSTPTVPRDLKEEVESRALGDTVKTGRRARTRQ
jgi:hypothetical protein